MVLAYRLEVLGFALRNKPLLLCSNSFLILQISRGYMPLPLLYYLDESFEPVSR